MHNFKIEFNFVQHFLKIKATFWPNLMTIRQFGDIIFFKYGHLSSMSQGSIRRDLIQKKL